MRQAVREQLRRGADYVKLMATGARSVERENPEPAQMTREEVASIVDEAHRLGLRVAAHAEGLDGARIAIEERVDTIEHGFSLHREPRLLELMAQQEQVLYIPPLFASTTSRSASHTNGSAPRRPGEAAARGGLPSPAPPPGTPA